MLQKTMTHQQALDTMAAERYLLDEMTKRRSTRSRNISSTAATARRKFALVNGFVWKSAPSGILIRNRWSRASETRTSLNSTSAPPGAGR